MPGFPKALGSGPSTNLDPGIPVHLFLTDRLCCPRCGPEFGLILLAQEVRDQRVLEGDLGCPNCRDQFPVQAGFADLRPPPRNPVPGSETPESGDDSVTGPRAEAEGLRMAAALGITEGPGTLLVLGPASRFSGALTRLVGGVEVVGIHSSLQGVEEREGVSRMQAGRTLPFFSASFRGVLLSGGVDDRAMAEGFRVVTPGGRVVVFDPTPENLDWVENSGFMVLLVEDGVLVAEREEVDTQPLVTLRGL